MNVVVLTPEDAESWAAGDLKEISTKNRAAPQARSRLFRQHPRISPGNAEQRPRR